MTPYLFYAFGCAGAEDLYILRCADDADARAKADWLLGQHPGRNRVEAWDEDRLVGLARPVLALVASKLREVSRLRPSRKRPPA